MSFELLFLFGAGFLGGVINSIAGGGSFIMFPALIYVGIPPIIANATNTFASCAGYISGAYAFRKDIYRHRNELPRLILISLIGGIIGAWLLLQTEESLFREAIPWLLLFATFLFIYGGKVNIILKKFSSHNKHAISIGKLLLALALLVVCVYGGFFNAGLGIIILSYLALAGYSDINTMNGLKLLVSSIVSMIAIAIFVYGDAISWHEGATVLLGTLIGGYVAANISQHIPQKYIRTFVIFASCGITIYFFFVTYIQ